jgi:hypothetical protein
MIDKKPAYQLPLILITIILWLLSVILAFLLFIPILESIVRIYAAFWADTDPIGQAFSLGVSLRNVAMFVLAILYVIGIIGGAEHHSRNFNTPTSWHVMFLTYSILLTMFLFTLFF